MIQRTYLGLDVRPGELRAVALHRHRRGAILAGGRLMTLGPAVLVPGSREANIREERDFVAAVREVLNPLAGREERIALSLPEGAGRLVLTECETPLRSAAEGREVLKWQLKNHLPADAQEVKVDYQVLDRSESGRIRVLVALVARRVLDQYEELLSEAGYSAQLIDFFPFNLYNYYRARLELGTDFLLVGIDRGTLSLQLFQGQSLSFFRSREVGSEPSGVFMEISRTLAGLYGSIPALRRSPVYLHCDWQDPTELVEALRSTFEREVTLLDPYLQRVARTPLDLPEWRSRGFAAAFGAAERLM